jgi:hypothetical protein
MIKLNTNPEISPHFELKTITGAAITKSSIEQITDAIGR